MGGPGSQRHNLHSLKPVRDNQNIEKKLFCRIVKILKVIPVASKNFPGRNKLIYAKVSLNQCWESALALMWIWIQDLLLITVPEPGFYR
jgi:hypothetical protein